MIANHDYKRAGLLLKLSLVFELAINVFITRALVGSGFIAVVIICVFYFFAHMVQEGKRWMKYPLLLWTVGTMFFAGFQLTAFANPDSGPITIITMVQMLTIVIPLGLTIWATIIVFRSKSEITDTDETIIDSPNPADTSER